MQDATSSEYNPYGSPTLSAGVTPNNGLSSTTAAQQKRVTLRDARQRELESQVAQLRALMETASSNADHQRVTVLEKQREAEEAVKCLTSTI